jgi:hypothetical protein
MNESFQRITAWAKAHPALSVGIVAALVLVGYLVYKRGGFSLSTTGAEVYSSGLTTGGGGGAALEDLFGSGAGSADPSYFLGGSVPEAFGNLIPSAAYASNPVAYSAMPQFGVKTPKVGTTQQTVETAKNPWVDSGSKIVKDTGVAASISKVATMAPKQDKVNITSPVKTSWITNPPGAKIQKVAPVQAPTQQNKIPV